MIEAWGVGRKRPCRSVSVNLWPSFVWLSEFVTIEIVLDSSLMLFRNEEAVLVILSAEMYWKDHLAEDIVAC